MTVAEFVRSKKFRDGIDDYINRISQGTKKLTPAKREAWVRENAELRQWATFEGVVFD